jgi:hypothetical protein
MPSPDSHTPDEDRESENITTAETSGITRLSRTESETEGAHLRRVADELSGSGEERLAHLTDMLPSRHTAERLAAARELGSIGSLRAIQALRDLLASANEDAWRLAIHGLRTGGSREGWLCLEGVAQHDAGLLGSDDERIAALSFRRLMAMGRTKMMDRLFRAADGHSRSIPGDVAKQFSQDAVATLPEQHRKVMSLRLGLSEGGSATPSETATALKLELDDVRSLELEAWQSIHSPLLVDDQ